MPQPDVDRFRQAYETTPPWDTGRPQSAFVELAEDGWIHGQVLDAGCGTGENALMLAERGLEVLGIDAVEAAVEQAREKAKERGLEVTFRQHDALDLVGLYRRFDTVLDSGLFHVFEDADRARYVQQLTSVTRPGGHLALLCFSEHEDHEGGPRRVTRQELREALADGWTIEAIQPHAYETRWEDGDARAWRLQARRDER